MLHRGHRQGNGEGRSLPDDALDGDRSPMRLDQRFGDGQSQTGLAVGRSGLIRPVKALEDMRQVIRLDTRAGVAHAQQNRLPGSLG